MDILTSEYAPLFAIPAIAGSFFFILRLAMMLIGAGGGEDLMDGGHDFGGGHGMGSHDVGGEGGGTHDHHQGDSTDAFRILSLQTIAGFVMGFGWGGLGAYRGMEWKIEYSLLAAVGGGALIVWMLMTLFRSIRFLQGSGNIHIAEAVGCVGSVYVGVPARGAGRGKVRLLIGNRARIYNAVSNSDELPRNTRVKVVMVNRDNTVTVSRDDG